MRNKHVASEVKAQSSGVSQAQTFYNFSVEVSGFYCCLSPLGRLSPRQKVATGTGSDGVSSSGYKSLLFPFSVPNNRSCLWTGKYKEITPATQTAQKKTCLIISYFSIKNKIFALNIHCDLHNCFGSGSIGAIGSAAYFHLNFLQHSWGKNTF